MIFSLLIIVVIQSNYFTLILPATQAVSCESGKNIVEQFVMCMAGEDPLSLILNAENYLHNHTWITYVHSYYYYYHYNQT